MCLRTKSSESAVQLILCPRSISCPDTLSQYELSAELKLTYNCAMIAFIELATDDENVDESKMAEYPTVTLPGLHTKYSFNVLIIRNSLIIRNWNVKI